MTPQTPPEYPAIATRAIEKRNKKKTSPLVLVPILVPVLAPVLVCLDRNG
ncbi:predicted protein [Sclerotinia sclerotiorum 1980 UF-70]|uniref:Uncharacterized protein n=1 Tax=Sclerotinia sclerotiorum (strain ATCC 18683 / 1980 / Ss-1) TaxID=665079 RepID=A7EKL0_SCLS1|nr:predicted protein [Sclerotinia sclerotiorum 1980 UF-70]EDO03376.1 predicted protein [Sclerotinia sclerotiorum 1980 UF-70]